MSLIPQFILQSEAILEQCTYGICIANTQGVMTHVNEAFKKITGLGAHYFIGLHVRDAVHKGIINDSSILKLIEGHSPSTALVTTMAGNQLFSSAFPVYGENNRVIHLATVMRSVKGHSSLKELREILVDNAQFFPIEARIVGHSPEIRKVFGLAVRLGFFDCPVLIQGETGVGKGLLARAIHGHSARRNRPFITINCGAIPSHLLESELFGYAHGAFTGAAKGGKVGLIEAADKGTLFLDEIGELPPGLQVKLLRVLDEHTLLKLGTVEERNLNIRIIASTNRDLQHEVQAGRFRSDLFYRLNVVPLVIPPLRNRREDVQELLDYYLTIFNERYGTNRILAGDALDALLQYDWPGNVRELANLIERLVITNSKDIVEFEDLPDCITAANALSKIQQKIEPIASPSNPVMPLREVLDSCERSLLENALRCYDRQEDAASALKISMSTLTRKLRKYRLNKTFH